MKLRWDFINLIFCIVCCNNLILERVLCKVFLIDKFFGMIEFIILGIVLGVILGVMLGVILWMFCMLCIDRLYVLEVLEVFEVERLVVDVFVEVVELESGFELLDLE